MLSTIPQGIKDIGKKKSRLCNFGDVMQGSACVKQK